MSYATRALALLACAVPLLATQQRDMKARSRRGAGVLADRAEGTRTAIEKSMFDTREYEHITLENGMDVMLIRDETTDVAAASVNVGVGSMHDPKEYPGLAHFLEHMLFLGSEKYPTQGKLDTLLHENGGMSNAYTSSVNTNYFFAIVPTKFYNHSTKTGALDMFANFFVNASLSKNSSAREANAVNNEHEKNKNNDAWRIEQVMRDIAPADHIYNRFETGNVKTLAADIDGTHAALVKFYNEYYCAKNMKASIVSSEPLATLKKWAEEVFSTTRTNCQATAPLPFPQCTSFLNPYPKNGSFWKGGVKQQLMVRTLQSARSLTLLWPMPTETCNVGERLSSYVSSMLGQETEGSVVSVLKKKGWLLSLESGKGDSFSMFDTFTVELELTELGQSSSANIASIINTVLRYINLIKSSADGVKEWRYDEMASLASTSFQMAAKGDTDELVSDTSSSMATLKDAKIPVSKIYARGTIWNDFNHTAIIAFLDALSADDVLVIRANGFEDETLTEKEAWYGTEYGFKDLDLAVGEKLDGLLPVKNQYVPSKLEKTECEVCNNKFSAPKLIRNDFGSSVAQGSLKTSAWWLRDCRFKKPTVTIMMSLYTPGMMDSAESATRAAFYASMVSDALNERSYSAREAGYGFNVDAGGASVDVVLKGYPEHMDKFIELVLAPIMSEAKLGLLLKEDRFNIIKAETLRQLENDKFELTVKNAKSSFSYLLEEPKFGLPKMYEAVEKMEGVGDVTKFAKAFFSNATFDVLMHGALTEDQANALLGTLSSKLAELKTGEHCMSRPTSQVKRLLNVKALASEDCSEGGSGKSCGTTAIHEFSGMDPDPASSNSAAITYWQLGPKWKSKEEVLYMELVDMLLSGPAFEQLRTTEQLGYIVQAGMNIDEDILGFMVMVQSSTMNSSGLGGRVLEFMKNQAWDTIMGVTDVKLQSLKASLKEQLTTPPQSKDDVTESMWKEISSRRFKFNSSLEYANAVHSLTLLNLKKTYTDLLKGGFLSVQLDGVLRLHPAAAAPATHEGSTTTTPEASQGANVGNNMHAEKLVSQSGLLQKTKTKHNDFEAYKSIQGKMDEWKGSAFQHLSLKQGGESKGHLHELTQTFQATDWSPPSCDTAAHTPAQ